MPEANNLITVKFKPSGHRELKKAINDLAKAQSKLEGGTVKYTKTGALTTKTNRLQSNSFATLRSKILLFNFAVGVLGVRALTNFAKQASKVDAMSRAFTSLSGGALNASFAVDKLKKATNGTMSEFNLFQQANNAMILGVSKNSDEMAEMFDIAQRLGAALGRDTASSVESLITGIGRQSRLMLDNIGIIVKSEEAYEAFAKELGKSVDNLTDAERKQAFLNATMDSARQKLKGLGSEVKTSDTSFQQFQASMEEFGVAIGKWVIPPMLSVLDTATSIANTWNDFLGTITDEPDIDPFMSFRKNMPKTEEGILAMITSLEAEKEAILGVGESVEIMSSNMGSNLAPATGMVIEGIHGLEKDAGNLIITIGDVNEANKGLVETMGTVVDGFDVDFMENTTGGFSEISEAVGSVDSRVLILVSQIQILKEELDKLRDGGDNTITMFEELEEAGKKSFDSVLKSSIETGKAYKNTGRAAQDAAESVVIAEASKAVAIAIRKALTEVPYPFNLILAGAAGAAAGSLIQGGVNSIKSSMKFEQGGLVGGRRHSQGGTIIEAERGEFVMSRNAVESVGLEAMNRINEGGSAGGINISFSGNIMTDSFIEDEAIPKIREAIRRGADIGVS